MANSHGAGKSRIDLQARGAATRAARFGIGARYPCITGSAATASASALRHCMSIVRSRLTAP
jgi:hypothetical protein